MAEESEPMLPCPFCQGSPCLGDNEDKEWNANTWWVVCDGCGARGPEQFDGLRRWDAGSPTRSDDECRAAAIAAWNRRTAQ